MSSSLESNRRIFDIAGTSPSENDNLLFDSKRSFFGIFSSSDELIHVYDIFSQHKKLQDLSQSEIKILFLDSLSESSQSSTDNKIFGIILPRNSKEYSLFVGSFGDSSVNLFRDNHVTQIHPNSQSVDDSKFHFYSSKVSEGDTIIITSYLTESNLTTKNINHLLQSNQTKTARKISQALVDKTHLANIVVKV